MTQLHEFIEHLKSKGLNKEGMSKELWLGIIDYFHKKEDPKQLILSGVVVSDYLGVRVDKNKAKNKHQIRDTVFRKGSDLNNN